MESARVHVINNGVDVARFLKPPTLRVEKRGPTVITAGGVKPRKGTLQLVEAIAVVRGRLPQVQCLIMGGRNEEARTQRRSSGGSTSWDCATMCGLWDSSRTN